MTKKEKLDARIINLEQAVILLCAIVGNRRSLDIGAKLFEAQISLGSPVKAHHGFIMGEKDEVNH